MALLFQHKVSSAFANKVIDVSDKLGIEPDWLMFVMYQESRLNPAAVNGIGCTGLIQFCADSGTPGYKKIGGVTYKLSDIKNMSGVEQLDLVYKYYKPYRSSLTSYETLFLATLTPAYLDDINNDGFVFPNNYYEANKALYFSYGNSMGSYKRTLADLVKKDASGFEDSFFEKKSDGSTTSKTRSIFRIYRREIIITIIVVGLLIALWFVGKKIFVKK